MLIIWVPNSTTPQLITHKPRIRLNVLKETQIEALRCQYNTNEWYDNLPWALMALHNSPKEDLGNFSPTDFVLGHLIRLPGKFFDISNHNDSEVDPEVFICKSGHDVASLGFMPPHQVDIVCYLDENLFSSATIHVYVRVDSHHSPLQSVYQSPHKSKLAKYQHIKAR